MLGAAVLGAVLIAGVRFPGALLAGVFYGFYAELTSGLADVTTFYTVAAIAAALAHPFFFKPIHFRITAVDISFAAFALYHAGSAVWSPNTMFGANAAITFLSTAGAVYLLAKLVFSTDDIANRFVEFAACLCALGIIMPLLLNLIGGAVFGRFRLDDQAGNIAVGLTVSLVITVIAAVTLIPVALKRHVLLAALPIATLISAVPFLFSTGTRGGFLGLSAGLLVLLAPRLRGVRGVVALAIAVVLAPLSGWAFALITSTESAARIFSFSSYTDGASVVERYELYQIALDVFADNPIFGTGLGGFRLLGFGYPHNFFLEIAADSGLVGLALALVLIFTCVGAVVRGRVMRIPNWGLFVVAVLIAGFVQQQVSFSLPIGKQLYLIGIISGLAAVARVSVPGNQPGQQMPLQVNVRERQPHHTPTV